MNVCRKLFLQGKDTMEISQELDIPEPHVLMQITRARPQPSPYFYAWPEPYGGNDQGPRGRHVREMVRRARITGKYRSRFKK